MSTLTLREDVLGSLGGFDSWWASQATRLAPPPPRLQLARAAAPLAQPFSFIAPASLNLSHSAPEALALGRRLEEQEPLVLPGLGPPQTEDRHSPPPPPPPPPGESAQAVAKVDKSETEASAGGGATDAPGRQLHGTVIADGHLGRGVVRKAAITPPMKPTMAERIHPHHPFHTAEIPLGAVPPTRRPERQPDPTSSSQSGTSRARRPAWDSASGSRSGGPSGLFDPSLRSASMVEEERRNRRRMATAAVSVVELGTQLKRVRARFEQTTGLSAAETAAAINSSRPSIEERSGSPVGTSRQVAAALRKLPPYQKAQLRRLSRLETEVDSLRREPLSGARDVAARRLLQEELRALSSDVMPAGEEWPGFEAALAKAAASARGGASGAAAGRVEGGAEGGAHDLHSSSFASVLRRTEARSLKQAAAPSSTVEMGHRSGPGDVEESPRSPEESAKPSKQTPKEVAESLQSQTKALETRLAQAEATLASVFRKISCGPSCGGECSTTKPNAWGSTQGTDGGGAIGSGCNVRVDASTGSLDNWGQARPSHSLLDLDASDVTPCGAAPPSISAFLKSRAGGAREPRGSTRRVPPRRPNSAYPPSTSAHAQAIGLCSGPAGVEPADEPVGSCDGSRLNSRERGEVLAALSVLDAICHEHDVLERKWIHGGGGEHNSFIAGASCVAALSQDSRQRAAHEVFHAPISDSKRQVDVASPTGASTVVVSAARRGRIAAAPQRTTLPARVERALWHEKSDFEERIRATGVKDPWRLIERLADDLLHETIDAVASELGSAADSAVETLCREEFGDC